MRRTNESVITAVLIVAIGALVIVFWSQLDKYLIWVTGNLPLEQRGQFGDQYNVLTSLLTAFTLIVILGAFVLQSIELRRVTRATEQSDLRARRSEFEKTFFELVRLHLDIASKRSLDASDARSKLRGYITESSEHARGGYAVVMSCLERAERRKLVTKGFDRGMKPDFGPNYGHWFRLLYRILLFIDNADDQVVDNEAKREFAGLLRATLTDDELVLWFYNTMTPYGEKAEPLVQRYRMLHNLPTNRLLTQDDATMADYDFFDTNAP